MGNCCRRESAMVWASVDEYWEDPTPQKDRPTEKAGLSGDDSRSPAATTPLKEQVKIKITKRELEELLATASMQDVPVDRVLSQLINTADFSPVQRRRSWAPPLHSIAE
ncbi:hypothetical protein CDL12_18842 [Handroanthus impetiginosus]|uniref:Uncharacterized protein n=1 Tax=Handroanthus impetiginosus TaxID=429701 RepID=A0A2G9GTL5_9LAMI|nr:hypothetical protein CDL12_18842 [Handroanthus impetiginosus]